MKNYILQLLIIFFAAGAIHAQIQFSDMQNLSNEYGPSDEHDIANIGDNYFLVWNQWGDIMFRKSENGGENWGQKLTLYTGFDYGASYPVIAAAGNHVYIVYYRNTPGNSEIFMVKSENGGQSFGNEMQITNSIKLAQVPQITASGDTVVVAYEDRDENWDYQIFLTYSTDAGTNWSEPVNLSNTEGNARWCNLATHGDRMVVVWNEQTGTSYNELDLFFTKTTDFGQSWSTPVNITGNGAYNARLNTRIVDNSVYVVVSAKIDGLQTDIMMYRSDDFGESWQQPVNLSENTGESARPDVWVASNFENNHRIYAVWSDDTYTGNDRAYLKYSLDNGFSWSELMDFSNATEDAGWVQIVGDVAGPVDDLYMVWYRPDDGTFNYEVWGRGAVSQVSSDVNLSGVITNEDAEPVENATIALGGYVVFSQQDGSYSLNVPAGTYDFSVSASGYQNYTQPVLELNENTVLDVTLTALVPGNYPPHNLKVEQQGVSGAFANWEAPIGFNSQELAYDDGEANGLYWVGSATGNEYMAVAFEHDESCYLRQAKLFTSPGTAGEEMKVWILGNDGGNPSMSTIFGGPFLVEAGTPWTLVEMDIPIPANVRFYVACQWEVGNLYKVGGDLNQPDGFSYSTSDGGENWYIHDEMDFMMRAGIATDQKSPLHFLSPVDSKGELMGYQLYLDGTSYGVLITENYFNFEELVPGYSYQIGVTAVYEDGESPPAMQAIYIPEPLLFPPLNLEAQEQPGGEIAIDLTWDAPASEGSWIHWDDGENSDAVGGENIEIFDAAIRFTTVDLAGYDGQYLTRISFFIVDADCQFFIRVWQGGNQNYAGDLMREQTVAYPIANEWNTYDLETPVLIDASEELWIGYRVINNNGVYPAGTDNGPAVPFKGDMLLYGSDWVSMSNYFGWNINWNIQGMVVSPEGADMAMITPGSFVEEIPLQSGFPEKIKASRPSDPFMWDYSHFNIYNQDELIGTANAGTFEFTDENIQIYNVYTVTTAWESFESAPSNEVVMSYVGADETRIGNDYPVISPNPTNGVIHLEFFTKDTGEAKISLIDPKGNRVAVLYDDVLDSGLQKLSFDLKNKGLSPGIYFVSIRTGAHKTIGKIIFSKNL
jgi:hypothetical protein